MHKRLRGEVFKCLGWSSVVFLKQPFSSTDTLFDTFPFWLGMVISSQDHNVPVLLFHHRNQVIGLEKEEKMTQYIVKVVQNIYNLQYSYLHKFRN